MRRRLALYALLLAPTVTALHRGDAAPAFVGENYDGQQVTLASATGPEGPRPLVLPEGRHGRLNERGRESPAPAAAVRGRRLEGRRLLGGPARVQPKFAEEHDFGYPPISNGEAVIRQFGACRREDRCTGKRTTAVIRADGTLLDFIDLRAPTPGLDEP